MFTYKDGYYIIEEFFNNGVVAVFTDKKFGNMSVEILDKIEAENNIKRLLEILGKKNYEIFSSKQVHEDKIYIIKEDEKSKYLEEYDSFITKNKSAVILTKYADCLPIFIYDKENQVIGIAHSGWRGTFLGIGLKTIAKMEKEFGTKKENIIIGMGIGMKGCCYEVGLDVYDKFKKKFSHDIIKKAFKIVGEDKKRIYFDNEDFNEDVFIKYGIKKENIFKSGFCTNCTGNFFSYRKEKEKSGRNGGLIFFRD